MEGVRGGGGVGGNFNQCKILYGFKRRLDPANSVRLQTALHNQFRMKVAITQSGNSFKIYYHK